MNNARIYYFWDKSDYIIVFEPYKDETLLIKSFIRILFNFIP